ncbi:MAG: TIGR03668 family PPOX class F420-dependent oxidoreductase [Thermodesulfobacteriota bacterium]
MLKPTDKEIEFIKSHRVARMATVDGLGRPLVVPICYYFDGRFIYTPIDKKPKRASPRELKRVRNIIENPNVSLVIDEYYEDWTKLYYVIINGRAEIIESGEEYQNSLRLLSEKYHQYRDMKLSGLNLPVIKIILERIISWGNF